MIVNIKGFKNSEILNGWYESMVGVLTWETNIRNDNFDSIPPGNVLALKPYDMHDIDQGGLDHHLRLWGPKPIT